MAKQAAKATGENAKSTKQEKPAAKQAAKATGENAFLVYCDCPTDLAFNPFRIVADDAEHARDRFLHKNGIVNTDHPITVTLEAEVSDEQRTNAGNDQNQSAGQDSGGNGTAEA